MPYLTSAFDGAQIFYRIHNPSPKSQSFHVSDAALPADARTPEQKPTLVFSHGWPMNSRMFDHLILPLVQSHRYRCVSYDRRGFGESKDWVGPPSIATTAPSAAGSASASAAITFDILAADLAQVIDAALPPGLPFIGIGASMGCAELIHALHLHPTLAARCAGLALIGSNLPNAAHDPTTNPHAPPRELWAAIVRGLRDDRQGFVAVALAGIFGAHVGRTLSVGEQARFEGIVDAADAVAIEACIGIVAEGNFEDEMRVLGSGMAFPVLVLHGDADQGFPLEAGPRRIPELVPRAVLKVYGDAAHGLWLTHKERCLEDILQLVEGNA